MNCTHENKEILKWNKVWHMIENLIEYLVQQFIVFYININSFFSIQSTSHDYLIKKTICEN